MRSVVGVCVCCVPIPKGRKVLCAPPYDKGQPRPPRFQQLQPLPDGDGDQLARALGVRCEGAVASDRPQPPPLQLGPMLLVPTASLFVPATLPLARMPPRGMPPPLPTGRRRWMRTRGP